MRDRFTVAESRQAFRLRDAGAALREIDRIMGLRPGSSQWLFDNRKEPYKYDTVKHLCETLCTHRMHRDALARLVAKRTDKAVTPGWVTSDAKRSKKLNVIGVFVAPVGQKPTQRNEQCVKHEF